MSEKDLKDANSEMETKSFDDSELEDIMNEIEELEKDFAGDDSSDDISEALGIADEIDDEKDLSVEKESVKSTQLQDVIDQEVEEILDDAIASQDEDPQPVVEEPVAEVEEPVAEVEEPVAEEPLSAEEQSEVEDAISARDEALEAIESKIVAFESSEREEEEAVMGAETRMDFAVSGQMKLKLNFEVAGQQVHLSVDEENGFLIEMDGGVRFSIPMENKKAS